MAIRINISFFFPSVMAGPTFSYASYAAFVDRSLFKSKGDGASERKEWMMPQGRYRKALKRFTIGAVYLGIYSTYGGSIGFERLLDPAFLAKNGFWKRCVRVTVLALRAKDRSRLHPLSRSSQGWLCAAGGLRHTHEILCNMEPDVSLRSFSPSIFLVFADCESWIGLLRAVRLA